MSITIRVKYQKGEEVKYVGHLDTMRTFTRCLRRTCIPVSYSKGFNPRIQISFALPLGVGITSECEFFDLELEQKMNRDMFLSEINTVLPQGFRALEVSYPEGKHSLMSLVREAKYQITIDDAIDWDKLDSLFAQEEIWVEKKSEKGTNRKNIKEGIIHFSRTKQDCFFHVMADSAHYLNPSWIIEAISQYFIPIENYSICRKELILESE